MKNNFKPYSLGFLLLFATTPAFAGERGEFDSAEHNSFLKKEAAVGAAFTAAGVFVARDGEAAQETAKTAIEAHRNNHGVHLQESANAEGELKELQARDPRLQAMKSETEALEKISALKVRADKLDLIDSAIKAGLEKGDFFPHTAAGEAELLEMLEPRARYETYLQLRFGRPSREIMDYVANGLSRELKEKFKKDDHFRKNLLLEIYRAQESARLLGLLGKMGNAQSYSFDDYRTVKAELNLAEARLKSPKSPTGLSQAAFEEKLKALQDKKAAAKAGMAASQKGFEEAEALSKFAKKWTRAAWIFTGAAGLGTMQDINKIFFFPNQPDGAAAHESVVSDRHTRIKSAPTASEGTVGPVHQTEGEASKVD